jgi:hypothetical protein
LNRKRLILTTVATLAVAVLLGVGATPAMAAIRAAAADDVPGTPMALPGVATGVLSITKTEDVYAVPLTAGHELGVTMVNAAAANFGVYLYRPGTVSVRNNIGPDLVAGSFSSVTETRTFEYTAPTSGIYYINVFRGSGDGAYRLETTLDGQVATAITINANPTSVKYPKPFVLSGALTPGVLHDPCGVEVKKPGSARWSYSSARLAYAVSGPSSLWWYRYTPNLRGVYNFRVKFLATTDRAGCTSRIIPVTVRR